MKERGYSEVPGLGEKVNGSIFHGDWKRREGTGWLSLGGKLGENLSPHQKAPLKDSDCVEVLI